MLYELRTYDCVPGRLPKLLARFENHTLTIWERHGIRPIGFWTVAIGDNRQTLQYMLAWESLAERADKWEAFRADPEWRKVQSDSEVDGPILARVHNEILAPTSFSKLK